MITHTSIRQNLRPEKHYARVPMALAFAKLTRILHDNEFNFSEVIDIQRVTQNIPAQLTHGLRILSIYHRTIFKDMILCCPSLGIALPCYLTMIEENPGETAIIYYNPTQQIASDCREATLLELSNKVSEKLDVVLRDFATQENHDPDLNTSWS